MPTENLLGKDELVLYRNNNGIASAGGFKVTSFIDSAGQDMKKLSGGGLSVFKDLAVPAGLFLVQRAAVNNFTTTNSEQVIDDKLYSKLVDLVDEGPKTSSNKRNTRKSKGSIKKKKKGTRRRKQ
jgi:hypothetical protein